MVRNDQTWAPVRTSKARMSPGAEAYSRLVADPEDDQVLEDLAGQAALLLDRLRIAVEPFPQIHHTVLAEARNGLAGAGVEGPQHVQRGEQQPAILAVGALPVVHAAHREALDLGRHPALRAGRRVDGDQRVAAGPRVDHVADDERIEVGVAVGIRPGDLQRPDVALGDLRGGHEPGTVRPAGIVAPFARGLRAADPARDRRDDDRHDGRRREDARPSPYCWCPLTVVHGPGALLRRAQCTGDRHHQRERTGGPDRRRVR